LLVAEVAAAEIMVIQGQSILEAVVGLAGHIRVAEVAVEVEVEVS
jgi:hypothetical protein